MPTADVLIMADLPALSSGLRRSSLRASGGMARRIDAEAFPIHECVTGQLAVSAHWVDYGNIKTAKIVSLSKIYLP